MAPRTGARWLSERTRAARDAGDFADAGGRYAASLDTFVTMDDQLALAELLEDIALLAARTGQHRQAVELVEAARVLRE